MTKTEAELVEERRRETAMEMEDRSLYTIKSVCFICGAKINVHKSFDYYMKYGNCCQTCSCRCGEKTRYSPHNKKSRRKYSAENYLSIEKPAH